MTIHMPAYANLSTVPALRPLRVIPPPALVPVAVVVSRSLFYLSWVDLRAGESVFVSTHLE